MPQSNLPYHANIDQELNRALIFSSHHLLAYHLAFSLSQHNIQVTWYHLPPSTPTFPSPDKSIQQKTLSSTPSQADWKSADYTFFLYPFESRFNLTKFLPLLTSTSSKLTFVGRFSQKDALLHDLQSQLSSSADYRSVLLDHIYGSHLLTTDSGFTEKIFTHLWQQKSLTLPAHPQTKLLPLYVKDAVSGLTKATFTPQTKHQLFSISPLEPVTLTDFALSLEDPSDEYLKFRPDFDLTQNIKDLKLPSQELIAHTQAQLNWQPQTDLNVSLRQTFQYLSQSQPQPPQQTPQETPASASIEQGTAPKPQTPAPKLSPLKKSSSQKPPKNRLKTKFKKLSITLAKAAFITLIAFSPFIYFVSLSYQAVNSLQASLDSLRSTQFEQSLKLSQKSARKLNRARQFLGIAHQLNPLPSVDQKINKYDQYFDVGLRLTTILETTAQSAQKGEKLYQTIINPQSQNFAQINSGLKTDLDYLYNQLSLLQSSLNKLTIQSRLKYIHQLKDIKSKIPDLRQRLQLGIAAIEILPQLVNTDTPQTYLVLLQNNQELRPTGGFISSISLLTFQNGHLTQTETMPVYQADAQLGGVVEAPSPLQQYLAEDSWYLRDSNWSPHFPIAADQAEWFAQKELNQVISGTVGLNLYSLQSILQSTGPISLNQPSITINAQNLFQQVNQHSQLANQPNSSPQIITPLTEKILSNITTGQLDFVALVRALDQSLKNQEITISLNSTQAQSIIEKNNWSGSLVKQGCPDMFNQTYCTAQTFSLVEANLGVNKANYFLSRRLSHTIDIQPQGQLDHQISVNYQNNTPQDSPSSGAYKTYTRFYLPPNSQLISSQLNNQQIQPQDTTIDPFLNLKVISFYYTIPSQQAGQLDLTIRSQQILNTFSPTSSLSINWQKQTGTGSLPASITINYPSQLLPEKITIPARTETQSLVFTQPLEADTLYAVQFNRLSQD